MCCMATKPTGAEGPLGPVLPELRRVYHLLAPEPGAFTDIKYSLLTGKCLHLHEQMPGKQR